MVVVHQKIRTKEQMKDQRQKPKRQQRLKKKGRNHS